MGHPSFIGFVNYKGIVVTDKGIAKYVSKNKLNFFFKGRKPFKLDIIHAQYQLDVVLYFIYLFLPLLVKPMNYKPINLNLCKTLL